MRDIVLSIGVNLILLLTADAQPCLPGWTELAGEDICYYIEETLTASIFDARAACEAFSAPDSKLLLEENAINVFNDLVDPTIFTGRFRIEGYQRNIPTGTWNWYENNPTSQPLIPQQTVRQTRDTFATLLIRLNDGVYYGNRNRIQLNNYICQSGIIPTTTLPTTTTPTTTTPTTTAPTTTATTVPPTTTTPMTTFRTTTAPTTTAPTTLPPTTIQTTTKPTTKIETTFPPTTPNFNCPACAAGFTPLESKGICYYIEEVLTASIFDARAACEAMSAPDSYLLREEFAVAVLNDPDDPSSISGRFRIEGYQRNDPPWNWYQNIPDRQPLTPQLSVTNVRDTFATLLIRFSDGAYYGNRNRNDLNHYICQSSCIGTTIAPTIPTTTIPTTTIPTTTIPTTTIPTTTTPAPTTKSLVTMVTGPEPETTTPAATTTPPATIAESKRSNTLI